LQEQRQQRFAQSPPDEPTSLLGCPPGRLCSITETLNTLTSYLPEVYKVYRPRHGGFALCWPAAAAAADCGEGYFAYRRCNELGL